MHSSKFAGDKVTLGLRTSIIVGDIIAFSFLMNAIYQHKNFVSTDFGDIFVDGLALAPVLLSLVWTVISLLLNFYKGAYHPGVDVGMELCTWLLVVGTVWYLILWDYLVGTYNEFTCNTRNSRDCSQVRANLLFASELISAGAIVVCGMLHFTLFVRACRETHLRRRLQREARAGDGNPYGFADNVELVKRQKHDDVA